MSPISGSKSDAWEVDVLKAATGQTTTILTTTPITAYLALFTGTLSGDTPGTEASGGSYARVSTAGKWGTPSAGSVTNNATISFAAATGAWSSGAALTHFGLYDAASGGNAIMYGDLTDQTKTVGSGDTISFPASSITLTES